jgi:hypothetical protein
MPNVSAGLPSPGARGALGVLGVLIVLALAYYASTHPMDLRVYYYGARGVFEGTRPVYGPASGLGWPMHYRYPPLFLLLFAPFAAMPLAWAAGLWVLLKAGALLLLLRSMSRGGLAPAIKWSDAHIATLLLITPYIVEEFRYGNVQFFVFALTAAALLISRERPVAAAASLALAISIKVWPVFFLPYLAVRRNWRVVSQAAVFACVLALLPCFYFGFSGNLNLWSQWLNQETHTQLGESEIWFPNQSLRGTLMRYLTVIDYSQVPDSNYPQINLAAFDRSNVRLVWVIAAGITYVGFLWLSNRRRHGNDWLGVGLAFCLVALLEPFTQKYALAVLMWPALVVVDVVKHDRFRMVVYAATVLALIQPLVPGASSQRLLQTLGMDFAVTALLAIAMLAACLNERPPDETITAESDCNKTLTIK